MTALLAVPVAAWLLLTVVGLAACAALPRRPRALLLPAAPVLGAALSVVVLHTSALVTGVKLGLVLLVLVAAALAVLGARRSDRALPGRRAVLALLLAPLAAAPGFALALLPSAAYDGAMVLPSSNHDAFYYAGVTEWLVEEPGLRRPELGPAPEASAAVPFEASALRHVGQGLRLGDSLVQAAVNAALGTEAETTFYPLTATWLVLLPAAAVAAARLLGAGTWAGLLTGAAAAASPVLVRQAYNQNSASLLGIALAPLALVAVADALCRRPQLPLWLPALVAGAWFGTYTEYAAVAVPALLLVLLLRHPRDWPRVALRTLALALLAALLAPLVVVNAARSLLFLSGAPPAAWVSPFLDAPPVLLAARVTGAATPYGGETGTVLPWLLVAVGLVGLAGAVAVAPGRRLWAAVLASAVFALAQYGVLDPRPYTQQRLVEIVVPLLVVVAGLGWAGLVRAVPARHRAAALAVALAAAALWTSVGLRSDVQLAREALAAPRPVDPSFEDAATWVREFGGSEGEDASVVAGGFFDQLWLAEALRDEREVGYPVLDPSYFTMESFWDGEVDPYLLVDRGAWLDAPPGAVLRENERFRLVDARSGPVVVAATLGFSAGQWYGAEPGPAAWMTDAGRLFVLRTDPAVDAVELTLVANPDLAPLPLTVEGAARSVTAAVPADGGSVQVPLAPGSASVVLLLRNLEPAAVAPSTGDPRSLSLRLTEVARAR